MGAGGGESRRKENKPLRRRVEELMGEKRPAHGPSAQPGGILVFTISTCPGHPLAPSTILCLEDTPAE